MFPLIVILFGSSRRSVGGEGEKRSNALFLAAGQIQQEVASSKENQTKPGEKEEGRRRRTESGKERDSEIVKVVALSLILAARIVGKKCGCSGTTSLSAENDAFLELRTSIRDFGFDH